VLELFENSTFYRFNLNLFLCEFQNLVTLVYRVATKLDFPANTTTQECMLAGKSSIFVQKLNFFIKNQNFCSKSNFLKNFSCGCLPPYYVIAPTLHVECSRISFYYLLFDLKNYFLQFHMFYRLNVASFFTNSDLYLVSYLAHANGDRMALINCNNSVYEWHADARVTIESLSVTFVFDLD
jgi:hypothetical protein